MFGSEVLDVAIGVIFIFLLTSLLASAIRELIEALLKTRAAQLEAGIRQLLDDPSGTTVTKELFDHPHLFGLFSGTYEPQTHLTPTVPRSLWATAARAAGATLRRFSGSPQSQDGQASAASPSLAARLTAHADAVPDSAKSLRWGSNLPSYIPSRNFASALLGVVAGTGAGGTVSLETIRANATALPEGRVREALLVAIGDAGDSIDKARASLESWFDSNMDRVSGWYKRQTQWILLGIGFALAAFLNIDSISAARELATNTAVRQQVTARVEAAYATMRAGDQSAPSLLPPDQVRAEMQGLATVIGWDGYHARLRAERAERRRAIMARAPAAPGATEAQRAAWADGQIAGEEEYIRERVEANLIWSLLGWLITALAVSLGAPFWFDILNKFMVIRSTVKPYEKSPPEGSEDRRAGTAVVVQPQGTGGGGAASQAGQAGQAAQQPAQQLGPLTAAVRLAVNVDELADLVLKKNGQPVPVPTSGFVELPLEVGQEHHFEATATRKTDGAAVSWSRFLHGSLDQEGLPVSADLDERGGQP